MAKEIRKMLRVSTMNMPLVFGCLGVESGQLEDFFLKALGIPDVLVG